jgi:hypothetical protein
MIYLISAPFLCYITTALKKYFTHNSRLTASLILTVVSFQLIILTCEVSNPNTVSSYVLFLVLVFSLAVFQNVVQISNAGFASCFTDQDMIFYMFGTGVDSIMGNLLRVLTNLIFPHHKFYSILSYGILLTALMSAFYIIHRKFYSSQEYQQLYKDQAQEYLSISSNDHSVLGRLKLMFTDVFSRNHLSQFLDVSK